MKTLHITVSVIAFAAAVCGAVFIDTYSAAWLCTIMLAVAALLQIFCIEKSGKSRLLRAEVSAVGFIMLLVQCGLCAGALLTDKVIFVPLCICALILLLLSLVRRKQGDVGGDDSVDAAWFPATLTEMMDTISRATAERRCGIDTQMLYECARFCEPCESPSARPLEEEILTAVSEMRPDDSDEVISQKCRAVLKQLDERKKLMRVTNK